MNKFQPSVLNIRQHIVKNDYFTTQYGICLAANAPELDWKDNGFQIKYIFLAYQLLAYSIKVEQGTKGLWGKIIQFLLSNEINKHLYLFSLRSFIFKAAIIQAFNLEVKCSVWLLFCHPLKVLFFFFLNLLSGHSSKSPRALSDSCFPVTRVVITNVVLLKAE